MAAKSGSVFTRFHQAATELRLFKELAWAGLDYAENAKDIAELVHDEEKYGPKEEQLKRADELERFAKQQTEKGFPYLHTLMTIRVWTLLETLVDDLVVTRLRDGHGVTDAVRKLRGPLLEFAAAEASERAEFLADLLRQEVKAKLKPGAGRFEALLDAVGLGGPVADAPRRYLLELSEVRNVLVHRDGRADARLVERCPWLQLKTGDEVLVSGTKAGRYVRAAQWYSLELSRRSAEDTLKGDARAAYEPAMQATVEALKRFELRLSAPESQ